MRGFRGALLVGELGVGLGELQLELDQAAHVGLQRKQSARVHWGAGDDAH